LFVILILRTSIPLINVSALAHHLGAKPNISKAFSDCITPLWWRKGLQNVGLPRSDAANGPRFCQMRKCETKSPSVTWFLRARNTVSCFEGRTSNGGNWENDSEKKFVDN